MLILKAISLGPGSPGNPGKALSGVYPMSNQDSRGQESGGGGGRWGWRLQVPLHTACPSLTAGPTGMRAELFVPGELLQPRER